MFARNNQTDTYKITRLHAKIKQIHAKSNIYTADAVTQQR